MVGFKVLVLTRDLNFEAHGDGRQRAASAGALKEVLTDRWVPSLSRKFNCACGEHK
jgi:hypothetical protein